MATGGSVILVLEDSDEDFDTLQEAVRSLDVPHTVHRATTGDECLAMLRGDDGDCRPAIVVLDLNTPGLDGRDALVEIRGNETLRTTPVIIVSTSANPKDLDFCYRKGANAYHVKPVSYVDHHQVLRDILDYWLNRVELPGPVKCES
jgi:CheY-like chemotaxis protein